MKWFLWVLLGAISCSGCSSFRDMHFIAVGTEAWASDLSGDIQFSDDLTVGSEIDLGNVLDIGDEDVSVFRGALKLGSLILDLKYFDANYNGNTTLNQTIDFDGFTFNVNSDVESDLNLLMGSGYLKFPVLSPPLVNVALLVGVNYLDVEAEIKSITPVELTASDDINIPVPVVGVAASVNVPLPGSWAVFGEAELAGLVIDDYEEIDGKFIDGSLIAGFRFSEWLRFGGGFRVFEVDFDDESGENEASIDLDGPFFFGEVVF